MRVCRFGGGYGCSVGGGLCGLGERGEGVLLGGSFFMVLKGVEEGGQSEDSLGGHIYGIEDWGPLNFDIEVEISSI